MYFLLAMHSLELAHFEIVDKRRRTENWYWYESVDALEWMRDTHIYVHQPANTQFKIKSQQLKLWPTWGQVAKTKLLQIYYIEESAKTQKLLS